MATGACCGPAAGAQLLDVTGHVALVSDYRFRGVTFSDSDPALQGSVSAAGPWGLSAGAWASTTSSRNGAGAAEIDLFISKSVTLKKTTLSVGTTAYLYPGAGTVAYGEATALAARAVGPVDVSAGLNYAWPQPSLQGRDNLYAFLNVAAPIAKVRKSPISLGAGLGYEQGAFFGKEKLDWKLSATAKWKGFDLSVSYVDADLRSPRANASAIFSISRAF